MCLWLTSCRESVLVEPTNTGAACMPVPALFGYIFLVCRQIYGADSMLLTTLLGQGGGVFQNENQREPGRLFCQEMNKSLLAPDRPDCLKCHHVVASC